QEKRVGEFRAIDPSLNAGHALVAAGLEQSLRQLTLVLEALDAELLSALELLDADRLRQRGASSACTQVTLLSRLFLGRADHVALKLRPEPVYDCLDLSLVQAEGVARPLTAAGRRHEPIRVGLRLRLIRGAARHLH